MSFDSSMFRLLDVNLNRANEGLRTIEDLARLIYEDLPVAQWIKNLRHDLARLTEKIGRVERLEARSTKFDVGTSITTPEENTREDWIAIIASAAERVTQSLRVLEEVTKMRSDDLSAQFKAYRYVALDRLAQSEIRLRQHRSTISARLYLLIDLRWSLPDFEQRLLRLAEAGVDLFQIRDKRADGKQLIEYARAAVAALGAGRVVVNDRVDVALAAGAGGVHVGQEDLCYEDVAGITAGRLRIGVSTHNIGQAIEAEAAGADCIGCGPTFPSGTKTFDVFAGIGFLKEVAKQISVPAFAIGGIGVDNVNEVVGAGIRRIAVSGAVLNAAEPELVVHRLKQELVAGL